ncbi:MAG: type I restriction-modification system subunit M N-terminal domain-containing protein, partial [Nocardioidaceae bacterium]
MATDLKQLLTRLWEAADSLRANSGLRSSEYSTPVLGLFFLRYADLRFAAAHEELEGKGSGRRRIGPADYHAQGVLYLHEPARFDHLLSLPEGTDLGQAVNDAMRSIENANPDLKGVLPRAYSSLPNDVLAELLRVLSRLPESLEGDGFGLIYEYFLGQFASSEGQKGGEFFTPTSIVKLIVEIIEPYHGKIYDP